MSEQPIWKMQEHMLQQVAQALGPELCRGMAFVGGCTTALMLTDAASREEVRLTEDVDLIVHVLTRGGWYMLEDSLRQRGFRSSLDEEVICRMRLPTGDHLGDAIEEVDSATDSYPAYYMINCAHPTHFSNQLAEGREWINRVNGIRANASRCSHAELDCMTQLDAGDPAALAAEYSALRAQLPRLNVLGGCCGTDHRHVEAIARECISRHIASHPAE